MPEYDGRHTSHIHEWFGLTYSHYLVLPRSLVQAMPIHWQEKMVALLDEMREATRHLKLNDRYTVLLRGENGRIVSDPYSEYRRPIIGMIGDKEGGDA